MNLARFSVRRPIFTTMVTLIVVVLGTVSLSRLRIDLLPTVELPTLTVRTEYEGASPEVMERLVTEPIEEIIATVPGVEEITSQSAEGTSNVRVSFMWGTDLNIAAQDVQARLDDEINELPDNIIPPRINKFDISSFPVVILGIGSDLDPVELTELIDKQVAYRFSRIPGVAQVDLWGGYNREVRIELDPHRIRALELPFDEVIEAIRNSNLDLPAGEIEQGRYDVTLRAPAEFQDLDEIRNTVVAMRENAPITIGQIADVRDTYQKLSRIVRINGERGLRFGIRKQADANTVEVSNRVLEEIKAVNRDFPQINVVAVINQGNFIERSIQNVARSVLYGGVLAVLVLLFFLRNFRSTVVISLAIPISIIATFALIYFGGFTLNLMTLGGLALGVGMMVDNSIVVLENIFRRRDEDHEPNEAASVNGASEVGGAIIASTLTTLVIFLPLVFVRGVSGILFKELAYVIVFSLTCSLLVALSLVPMLASKLLKSREHAADDSDTTWTERFANTSELLFRQVDYTYRDLLRVVLRHRVITITLAVVMLLATLFLAPLIGTEFLPPSDEGEVRITGEMEIGTRLELIDKQTQLMEEIIFPLVPEVVASSVSVGASGRNPADASQGEIRLTLNAAKDRQRSNTEIANLLRRELAGQIPGMEIRTRAPQGQFILDRILGGGDTDLTIEIRGYDLDTLKALGSQVMDSFDQVEGIIDPKMSQEQGMPQEYIRVNRDKIADMGLNVRQVAQTLETAVAGSRAGDYRSAGNSYRILVQLQNAEKLSIDDLLDLTLATPDDQPVAMRNVVDVNSGRGPIVIDRKDQQRVVTVTANVVGRDLGTVAAEMQQQLQQIPRPLGYDLFVSGQFEEQQEAFNELLISLALALMLVYMVLACQYESLRDPLVVMLSVPLAAIGVLLMLFLTNTTLNVQSYIGCIMLGGIVVNNAILLVDQANQLQHRPDMSIQEAIAEAGRRRLRPILMTTLTTILGLLPLALGIGEGADAQAPLARAVIGGLLGSTLITLVLIPAVYSLMHGRRNPAAKTA